MMVTSEQPGGGILLTTPSRAAAVIVNGATRTLVGVPTHTSALDFLRGIGLTGCKEGCAEGECGACSVLVARPGVAAPTEWIAINACLLPITALDGQEVVTAEGLGTPGELHPVQYEMAVRGGSQCGYCTPGFICAMAAEFYRPDRGLPAADHIDQHPTGTGGQHGAPPDHGPNGFDLPALSGNLCRCTGYRPIRDAAYALGAAAPDDPFTGRLADPPPPPVHTSVHVDGRHFTRPASLAQALQILHDRPGTVVVAGCTDWGVEVNIRGARADRVMAIDRLPELRGLTVDDARVDIGAAMTLTEIERLLDGRVPLLSKLFAQFASRLIRNAATIGGNLGTGSPIGDSAPALLALDASLVLAGPEGTREVPLADYFTGYRRSVRGPAELITRILVPLPLSPLTAFHKIAKRRFDDISSVAVGYAVQVRDGVIWKARIGLGGIAATPIRALRTENMLEGRPFTGETIDAAGAALATEGTPLDDHRASARYRARMLGESLAKFFAESPETAT